jgi:hypothetical protein
METDNCWRTSFSSSLVSLNLHWVGILIFRRKNAVEKTINCSTLITEWPLNEVLSEWKKVNKGVVFSEIVFHCEDKERHFQGKISINAVYRVSFLPQTTIKQWTVSLFSTFSTAISRIPPCSRNSSIRQKNKIILAQTFLNTRKIYYWTFDRLLKEMIVNVIFPIWGQTNPN